MVFIKWKVWTASNPRTHPLFCQDSPCINIIMFFILSCLEELFKVVWGIYSTQLHSSPLAELKSFSFNFQDILPRSLDFFVQVSPWARMGRSQNGRVLLQAEMVLRLLQRERESLLVLEDSSELPPL